MADQAIEHVIAGCTCPGKWCKDCEHTLCFGLFYKDKTGRAKYGLKNTCKPCSDLRTAIYRKNNPQRIRDIDKASRQRHPEKIKEKNHNQWQKNKHIYGPKHNAYCKATRHIRSEMNPTASTLTNA